MIKWSLWLLAASLACGQASEEYRYKSPVPAGNAFLAEHFDNPDDFADKWIRSQARKEDSESGIAEYDGIFEVEAPSDENHLRGDLGMVMKTKARHYAISAQLKRPFIFDHRPLIVQYEVQFQNGMECGGAYLKLISQDKSGSMTNLQNFFDDKTRYSIMFGPDKCGTLYKLQLIFQHKNPITGFFEEKHWKSAISAGGAMNGKFMEVFNDKKPHQYTLILSPDNTFEIKIDGRSEAKGHMLEDFDPPVNPAAEIEDYSDTKPVNWDEREKIPDPAARKPEDWNENEPKEIEDPDAEKPIGWLDDESTLIPDPEAKPPQDWDDDMDGVWEAPLIDNPKCKNVGCGEWKPPMVPNPKYRGKWRPPMIDNPAYKGKWRPRMMKNPDYFEDLHPFRLEPVVAVGFELWTMTDGILFDNILVTDDKAVAAQWSEDGFRTKRRMLEKSQSTWFAAFVDYSTQYPWLWAVYVLGIGIPVALIISWFCMPKSTRYEERGRSKKADLEDDPQGDREPLVDVDEETEADDPELEEETCRATEPAEKSEEAARDEDDDYDGDKKEDEEEDKIEEDQTRASEVIKFKGAGEPGRGASRRRPRKDKD